MISGPKLVLQNLLFNQEYTARVLPFLQEDYFETQEEKVLFKNIRTYVEKFQSLPTYETIQITIESDTKVNETVEKNISKLLSDIKVYNEQSLDWLIEYTEKFCQDRALYNAITKSVEIYSGDEKTLDRGIIPDLMKDALSITFQSTLGHDYINDSEHRFDYYHRVEEKVPFDLDYMNKITKGGFSKKTLNVFLAGCVDEDTEINIKTDINQLGFNIKIKDLPFYLENKKDVKINTPDGYQPVLGFVDKGIYQGFSCVSEETGKEVIVNRNHLFETENGWELTKDITDREVKILTENGIFESCKVTKLDTLHRIVDLEVGHPNHRYYANGFSSHNTHAGKSALMCHMAAANIRMGKNALYITLEMAEEEISKRIDANIFDISLNDLMSLSKDIFLNKINIIKGKTKGKLIVKEYPMASAHVGHFRTLLNDLRLKQNFVPDIIYIDYINICQSIRVKPGANANSYTIIKSISEELRALSFEFNVPVVSATQFNRQGADNSDPGMGDVSESFALNFGIDFGAALIASDDLKAQGMICIKQLKNRYNGPEEWSKFFLGFRRDRMKFFDVDGPTNGITHNQQSNNDIQSKFNKPDTSSKSVSGFKF